MYGKQLKILMLFVLCISSSSAKEFESLFKYCYANDLNRDDCLKKNIQDGISVLVNGQGTQYKIPDIDPVKIESATIGQGTGPVNVVQNYRNLKIHNLARSISIVDLKSTIKSDYVKIEAGLYIPFVRLEADYNFNGRILLLPIVGDGKCDIRLENVTTKILVEAETVEKNGKIYANVKICKLIKPMNPNKVIFKFENLFNGNKQLSVEMHKILNENWKEVFADVREGYEEMITKVFQSVANNVLSRIEYKKVFLQ